MVERGLIRSGKLQVLALSSSTNKENERVKNPILFEPNDRWCSADTENQWYQTIFLNGYAYLDKYLFQSSTVNTPKSWYVEGYTLKSEWINISEGKYEDFQSELNKYYDFNNRGPFTSIKLQSTG